MIGRNKMIFNYLKYLPYKIVDKDNVSYYLNITKCYSNYRVTYWDFDNKIIIKQFHKDITKCLRKTIEAFNILKELKEIK